MGVTDAQFFSDSCTSWRIAYRAAALWQGLRLHRGPCIGVGPPQVKSVKREKTSPRPLGDGECRTNHQISGWKPQEDTKAEQESAKKLVRKAADIAAWRDRERVADEQIEFYEHLFAQVHLLCSSREELELKLESFIQSPPSSERQHLFCRSGIVGVGVRLLNHHLHWGH